MLLLKPLWRELISNKIYIHFYIIYSPFIIIDHYLYWISAVVFRINSCYIISINSIRLYYIVILIEWRILIGTLLLLRTMFLVFSGQNWASSIWCRPSFGLTLYSFWELNGSCLYRIDSPSPKHALCQVWLKLAQWYWRSF